MDNVGVPDTKPMAGKVLPLILKEVTLLLDQSLLVKSLVCAPSCKGSFSTAGHA